MFAHPLLQFNTSVEDGHGYFWLQIVPKTADHVREPCHIEGFGRAFARPQSSGHEHHVIEMKSIHRQYRGTSRRYRIEFGIKLLCKGGFA
uniref:Uncharacterized protein n=1 Tax=Rhizobium leguminosarum TaxID=384 RepID=A0A179BPY0_RHILE|nr:hypothetical protein A4U53_23805 [Rhizobium leguminosarum]